MASVLLVNGPNLNLLGQREPRLYGHTTLKEVESTTQALLESAGHRCNCFQSNQEGALLDWLQGQTAADFILINAASLTHTSVALRDTLAFLSKPFIEIHISNVYKREAFRHQSCLSSLAEGIIIGLGVKGYELAAQYAIQYLKA